MEYVNLLRQVRPGLVDKALVITREGVLLWDHFIKQHGYVNPSEMDELRAIVELAKIYGREHLVNAWQQLRSEKKEADSVCQKALA
jgi:hypothetical protein